MGMMQEFKEFAVKGNVVDMAVGIIIGGAFGKIANSLVADVIMPPIGVLLGKVNFADLKWVIQPGSPAVEAAEGVEAAAEVPEVAINFIPHLAPFNRGINSTILYDAAPGLTLERIGEIYADAYGKEQFIRILPAKRTCDTKYVFMTNCCEIGYNLDPHTNKVIVTSAIDNLTKGAAGQAVQCMNIAFGIEEAAGLI